MENIRFRKLEKQREILRSKQRQKYAHQVLSLQKRTECAGINSYKVTDWGENKFIDQSSLNDQTKNKTDVNYYAYDGPQSYGTTNPDDFPTNEIQVIRVLTRPTPTGHLRFDQAVKDKPNSKSVQDDVVDFGDYKSTDGSNNFTVTRSSTMLSSLDQDGFLDSAENNDDDDDERNENEESQSSFIIQKQAANISDNTNGHYYINSYNSGIHSIQCRGENSNTGNKADSVEKSLDLNRSHENSPINRKFHAPQAVLVNRSDISSLSGSLKSMQCTSNFSKENKSEVEHILTTLENSLDLSENSCQKLISSQVLDLNIDYSEKPNVRKSCNRSSTKTDAAQECEDFRYSEAPQSLLLDPTENLEEFIMKPAPQGVTVRCRITRDKQGVDRGIFPSYYLHLEKGDRKFFLLAARRRKRSTTSNYVISCDATNLSRDGISFAGKLRSNFLGTHFIVYGCELKSRDNESLNSGSKVDDCGRITTATKTQDLQELAAIIYDTNVLGFKGPRKMTIILPRLNANFHHFSYPRNDTACLIDSWKRKDMQNVLQLQNKNPVWNEETQSYVLNFHGRVTQASVKNFQIVHESDDEYILMQFGRIAKDVFTMDYMYPMCALQAFGIALSSFDSKLACE
ncbi:unnamed protein product [Schistosoma turkestanicum]|nr:unnamed protein product [Schistosoma turkestanicum]